MKHNVYIYILVMAGVTYFIRLIPLGVIKKEMKSRFVKSFLYYVPFVTLAAMTFPAILDATGSTWSALAGFLTAVFLAYKGKGLFKVSIGACLAVLLAELIICPGI